MPACSTSGSRTACPTSALSRLHVGQGAIIAAGVAAVMLLAGDLTLRGAMTVGDLVLVNSYVIQICLPLNALGFVFREAKDALVNTETLFALLDRGPTLPTRPTRGRSRSTPQRLPSSRSQLIPLTDLLPLVDDPEEFERELRALDVPAGDVRHPAVFGPLGRSRGIAVHEVEFVRTLTELPLKVALPGPYLLTRTMWMECISDRAYASREDLARDVVRVLCEEIACLLGAGAALVQLDEPVLSEVVYSGPATQRSFMCGALSARSDAPAELAFARDLVNAATEGFPVERLALHMCRGNWTADETKALSDYRPLIDTLSALRVGTLLLELCTPRAGEMAVLKRLPAHLRVGVGASNQKHAEVESVAQIVAHVEQAISLFGAERVLLTPDCGFATFADNPVNSQATAEAKLAALAQAARTLRERHRIG